MFICLHLCHLTAPEPDQTVSHRRERRVMGDENDRNTILSSGVLQEL